MRRVRIEDAVVIEYDLTDDEVERFIKLIRTKLFDVRLSWESLGNGDGGADEDAALLEVSFQRKDTEGISLYIPLRPWQIQSIRSDVYFVGFGRRGGR